MQTLRTRDEKGLKLNSHTEQIKPKYQYTAIDYVILVAAILICLWSWIFLEADTLQHSRAAQTIVKIVTSVAPWVAALEDYGPQAHRLLLVHSVCHLVFFPLIYFVIKAQKPKFTSLNKALLGAGLGFLLAVLFTSLYFNLDGTFAGTARRGGFSLMIYSWSMPITASFFVSLILFWIELTLLSVFHIISMLWRQHG